MQKVIIDIMPMHYPNTGTYYYCKYFIEALKPLLEQEEDIQAILYSPKEIKNIFKKDYKIKTIRKWHKKILPLRNVYDIWHTTFQLSPYYPYKFKGKKIFTIHDLNFLYENISAKKKQELIDRMKIQINHTEKIVAISQYVKKDILKCCEVPSSKISVIYNGGININDLSEMSPPKNIPNRPFFFTLGMMEDKKNFKVLPSMLVGNDYALYIAGKMPDKKYCEEILREAKKHQVADRVFLLGPISNANKNWYYKNCLAVPFPSKAEGFGLPVIEAMHFGKPVILSNLTSLPEIGGDIAFYFDDFDASHIQLKTTEALDTFYSDEQKFRDLSIQRANFFTWDKTAANYLALYKELLTN